MVLNLAENGKRKQKWISTNLPAKGNKRKAEQMLRETITEYERTPQKTKETIILFNPCQFAELPHKEHFEASFYTAEQLRRLFETAKGDSLYPLIKITALYGLRRSEVLGLKWDSVDFEANRITIRRTVSKVTKAVEKNKTKNSSSHRSFPLTPEARRIFLEVKAGEEESRRLFGNSYVQNDYVFKWPNRALFSPDYVSHHFSLILKQGGLPHIRFHELRHPYVKVETTTFLI